MIAIADLMLKDSRFLQQLLGRMKSDCDYYLGNGGRYAGHLWAGDPETQIKYMNAISYELMKRNEHPFLYQDEIDDYREKMTAEIDYIVMDLKCDYRVCDTSDHLMQREVARHFIETLRYAVEANYTLPEIFGKLFDQTHDDMEDAEIVF